MTVGSRNNPYPGLRPFDQRDSRVFFGRDDQVDALLDRLDRSHFIAVVGTSASGKSSLVRAGLLPALLGGHLTDAGSHWRVAVMRPGGAAIPALANALDEAGILGTEAGAESRTAIARAVLSSGELGLIEIVREARLPADQNILLVVDQFEELFRFRHDRDDAPAFVKLLLAASADREHRIYVLLTMRSDFLGDCSQFRDLPEAVSGALFLVPRLTRDQLREAIDGPAGIAGGDISPLLVTKLLNDLIDSSDQLPVLQHALMRTWDIHRERGAAGEIGTADFLATGGLDAALSNHGDEIYTNLPPRLQSVGEKVFRGLTDRTSDERGIRRPTALAELCAVTGASRDDVVAVVEAFRAQGVSFLMPPPPVTIDDDTVIDVSHESLMRVWTRMRDWADDESRSARIYRRIADAADLHERGAGALLIDPALTVDLAWRDDNRPTAAWAERYAPGDFERSMRFLDASAAQRDRAEKAAGVARRRRAAASAGIGFALVIAFLAIAGIAVVQRERGNVLAAQSRALARDAQAAIDSGDAVSGGLIALAALPEHIDRPDRPFTLEAYDALERATSARREMVDFAGGAVGGVSFSPDGRFLANGEINGIAKIWDLENERLVRILRGHSDDLTSASWSPSGRYFLTSSLDRTARLSDATTFKTIAVLRGHTDCVITAMFSPNSKNIVTASWDGSARIWTVPSGKLQRVLRGGDVQLWLAAFSPNGRNVVTVAGDGRIRIWDAATGAQMRTFVHPSGPAWVDFSPDGARLASVGIDGKVRMWDVATAKQLFAAGENTSRLTSVHFSPDGRRLVTTSFDHTAQIRDAATGSVLFELAGADGRTWTSSFSPDGTKVATGSGDRRVRVWDVRENAPRLALRASKQALQVARYARDGSFGVAGDDGMVRMYDAGGRRLAELHGHDGQVADMAFSPDGSRVATVAGGIARTWNARTGAADYVLRGPAKSVVSAVAYSGDGKLLAIAFTGARLMDDSGLIIVDAANGARRNRITVRGYELGQLAFSPDGRRIAEAATNSQVLIWNVGASRIERRLDQPDSLLEAIAYSPDGERIVTGSIDGSARVEDARDGDVILELHGHTAPVESVKFTPDGRLIVTASIDKTVRIWDATSGAPVYQIALSSIAADVAVAPDGHELMTASIDGYVRFWPIPTPPSCQELIDSATRTMPRRLTPTQRTIEGVDATRASPLSAVFMGGAVCPG